MNTLIQKPTKQERAAVIIQAAKIIAGHCGAKWESLFSPKQIKSPPTAEARAMFALYLNRNGIGFAKVGSILKRNENHCRDIARKVSIRLMPEDVAMMDSLPKIPNWRRVSI